MAFSVNSLLFQYIRKTEGGFGICYDFHPIGNRTKSADDPGVLTSCRIFLFEGLQMHPCLRGISSGLLLVDRERAPIEPER